ncbi:MAG: HAMP domain-containing sensor histidine kinase [Planctomycetota bacterium]
MDENLREALLDAMKELAYGASHEINNPLANIAARAQALSRDEPHPERRRSLEAIHQQAMRAHEMISDLMLFARPPALELAETDLPAIAFEACEEFREEADSRGIEIRLANPEGGCLLTADGGQLSVVARELLRNAVEAVGEGGVIDAGVARLETPGEPALVEFSVVDNGPGLTEREQKHLFEPFFSGREAGRGLGFGLSKAWRIVTGHGGTVSVENRVADDGSACGVVAVVRLPVSPNPELTRGGREAQTVTAAFGR